MKHVCSFSEAIRAADGVLPQSHYGPGARAILNVDKGKVCAIEGGLQMMGTVSGDPDSDFIYKESKRRFRYLQTITNCPVVDCDEEHGEMLHMVWHLNDDHRYSFAQIADWLESEEEKLGFVTVVEPEYAVESAEVRA